MKRMFALSTALLLGAFIANPAKAAVINGDFTAGLTGWDSLGDVAVLAGAARLSTASLDVDDFPAAAGAFNLSGNAAAPVGQPGGVEEFAGLPLGQLDPDPLNGSWAFEGSALRQTLAVQAGDTLRFDWHLGSNEDPLIGMNDYAFVVIGGVLAVLDDVFTGLGSGSFSHTFNAAGSIDVVFGIVDVGDYVGSSWLSIDAVRIATTPQPVSAPGSLALALAGVGVLARRLRHSRG
ncbi:hypothetical protein [Zoogloea sp.]|uniref:hypothetical protein n=1 Tax=Zoogloea sp. TaxID=49181 RepID=UPI0035B1A8A1